MRIVFCGHGDFGYTALKALIDAGKNIVQVYTHPSNVDPNTGVAPFDLEALCRTHGLPCNVRTRADTAQMAPEISVLQPDLLVSVTWRALFPQDVIDAPRLGAMNIHGSLLPKYRGNAPIAWAIINGDKTCGITAHMIEKGMDTGDIIEQKILPIHYEDTVATLMGRMLTMVGPLVVEAVEKLSDPTFKPVPQDHSHATIAKKRRPEDGVIDWSWSAERLYNWVRALTNPLPGAFTHVNNGVMHIWRAYPDAEVMCGTHDPGSIVAVEENFIVVQTGQGLLRVDQATLQGQALDLLIQDGMFKLGDVLGMPKP